MVTCDDDGDEVEILAIIFKEISVGDLLRYLFRPRHIRVLGRYSSTSEAGCV